MLNCITKSKGQDKDCYTWITLSQGLGFKQNRVTEQYPKATLVISSIVIGCQIDKCCPAQGKEANLQPRIPVQ